MDRDFFFHFLYRNRLKPSMAQVKALKRSNDDFQKQRKTFETELESRQAKLKSSVAENKNKNMAYGISRHICKCNFVIYFTGYLVPCILLLADRYFSDFNSQHNIIVVVVVAVGGLFPAALPCAASYVAG